MVFFCAVVGLYAVYVALLAVPAARREMTALLAAMERGSDQRWGSSDEWGAAALASTGGLARGPGQALVSAEQDLALLDRRLRHWARRAAAATQLVEGHLRDFHGFGDVRHTRIVFVALAEEDKVDSNATAPLVESLEALAAQGAAGAHLSVYWAAPDADAGRRRAAAAAGTRVRQRRAACARRGLDCAAERAFAEGAHYVAAARADWRLVAQGEWAAPLLRGFKVG